jgi:hypothetical protein
MRTASVGGGHRQKSLTKIEPAESGGAPADHLGSERDARTPFWFDNPNFCQRLLTAFSKNPRGGAGTAQMEVGSDQFYDREVQQVKSQSARLKGLRKSGPKKGGTSSGRPIPRPGSKLPSLPAIRPSHARPANGFFNSPGRSTLSSCRPSPLHGRWRDWCRAVVPSGGRCPRRLTKARYPTSWSQGRRGSCRRRPQ